VQGFHESTEKTAGDLSPSHVMAAKACSGSTNASANTASSNRLRC
jgi:hypothetical protein